MTTQAVEVARANVPPVAATARAAGKSHLWYIDNLRMIVITLVVVMHVAIMYGAEGAWFYHEAGEKDTLVFVIMMLLGGIGTAFVMGCCSWSRATSLLVLTIAKEPESF